MNPDSSPRDDKRTIDARFLEAVQQLISREGFKNERQFLLAVGANHALLTKIRAGIQSAPKSLLQTLGERYYLNTHYILTGEGEPFLRPAGKEESNAKVVETPGFVRVPFLNIRAAATFAESFADDALAQSQETILVLGRAEDLPSGAITFEVAGDSMEEQLRHGTRVLAYPVPEADWQYMSSGVYAVIYTTHFVIKRVKNNELMDQGWLELHSDNPRAGSVKVMRKDLRKVWKVVRIVDSLVL